MVGRPVELKVHKDPLVADLLKGHGILLRFTPAYSPDLNPIEMTWAKLKSGWTVARHSRINNIRSWKIASNN